MENQGFRKHHRTQLHKISLGEVAGGKEFEHSSIRRGEVEKVLNPSSSVVSDLESCYAFTKGFLTTTTTITTTTTTTTTTTSCSHLHASSTKHDLHSEGMPVTEEQTTVSSLNVQLEEREKGASESPSLKENEATLQKQDSDYHSISACMTSPSPDLAVEDGAAKSQTRATMYQLIEIKPDMQDSISVDKIILIKKQILSLCLAIVPGTAEELLEGEVCLRFGRLNKKALSVVGFYGEKQLIMETLESCGVIAQADELFVNLRSDKLSPGMYTILHEDHDTLYVFYWHSGQAFPAASRNEISCNFVRYLVDLCDSVYALLEGGALRSFFATSKGKTRESRVRRMKVETLKADNAIEFFPGFSLTFNHPGLTRSQVSEGNLGIDPELSYPRPRFAAGDRCTFLIPEKSLPTMENRQKEISLIVKDIRSQIDAWLKEGFTIVAHKLNDEDLGLFLQTCPTWPGGSQLIKLLADAEEVKQKEKVSRSEPGSRQARLEKMEDELDKFMRKFLTECTNLMYMIPWEQALSRSSGASLMNKDEEPPLSGSDRASSSRGSGPSGIIVNGLSEPDPAEHESISLNQLKEQLWRLNSDNPTNRFIFPRNRVKIFEVTPSKGSNSPERQLFEHKGCSEFSLEHHKGEDRFEPAHYGEYLLLKPWREDVSNCDPISVRFAYRGEEASKEPILIGDFVHMAVFFNPNKNKVFVLELVQRQSCMGGLKDWVDWQCEKSLPRLAENASLLALAMQESPSGDWTEEVCKYFSEIDITRAETIPEFEQMVEGAKHTDEYREAYKQIGACSKRVVPGGSNSCVRIPSKISAPCEEHFKRCWGTLSDKIQRNMKGFSSKRFSNQMQIENVLADSARADALKLDIHKQLKEVRESGQQAEHPISQHALAMLVTLSSVSVHGSSKSKRSKSYVDDVKKYNGNLKDWAKERNLRKPEEVMIHVRYDQQRLTKLGINWNAINILPTQEDLAALTTNPSHCITPSVSPKAEPVLVVDPEAEKIVKFIILKSGIRLLFTSSPDIHEAKWFHVKMLNERSKYEPTLIEKYPCQIDLVAYDEETKYLGLYEGATSRIKIYRFYGEFKHLDHVADAQLEEIGVKNVTWMEFIPGKGDVVFVDSKLQIRVFKVKPPSTVSPVHIQLSRPILRACITRHGPCLLLFHDETSRAEGSTESQSWSGASRGNHIDAPLESPIRDQSAESSQSLIGGEQILQMGVYWIDETISLVKTVPVPDVSPSTLFEVTVVSFGAQEQLVIYTGKSPNKITSRVLKITSASEAIKVNSSRLSTANIGAPEESHTGQTLEFLYHVYEKYATNPVLVKQPRELSFHAVLNGLNPQDQDLKQDCLKYLHKSLEKLTKVKGKSFDGLEIHKLVHEMNEIPSALAESRTHTRLMGDWIRQLLCLVPIQIARAENNSLKPLADGFELLDDVFYSDTVSLANVIRFGLYEAIFAGWKGSLKVISSMGKQSSGKSFLLNHLSGALLDVSGGRCTNGVWMTLRISDNCLYVLLDFEGQGTFERTEQEDMLLSVLNAAVSNITIFNKKDFHLDKETETVFQRFQSGVALLRKDPKLFKGQLYMAIKDVSDEDIESLQDELEGKIRKIIGDSDDNFLTKMFHGDLSLATMAPFNTRFYYESIEEIGLDVHRNVEGRSDGGRSFSTDLKLVIAQLCAKDWAPIQSTRVALRLNLLNVHLKSVISMGRLETKSTEGKLLDFDTQQEIADEPIRLGSKSGIGSFSLSDSGLKLSCCNNDESICGILENLRVSYSGTVPRNGEDDEQWHTAFGEFVGALVDRRKARVSEWLSCNLKSFAQDGEIRRIQDEAMASLVSVKQNLSLCTCTCKNCFLRCTKQKGHVQQEGPLHDHSCLSDHRCLQLCTYCTAENIESSRCGDKAGHQGPHDCKDKQHTCKESCVYRGKASNCNESCSEILGHWGGHKCNTYQHMCLQNCSLKDCPNRCALPFDFTNHSTHACHEKFCPELCSMDKCSRPCGSKDHFHKQKSDAKHFCEFSHPCQEPCEAKGNCTVHQQMVRTRRRFTGKHGNFEYDQVAEQTAKRLVCCVEIEPFKETHEGPHSHSASKDLVHTCSEKCRLCGYFCTKPSGHQGLHDTVHGNMKEGTWAGESDLIEVEHRKYALGESGIAEMCNMFCRARGRGHLHIVKCPEPTNVCYSRSLQDRAWHETKKYGPREEVPKDEMSHSAYWELLGFADPCSKEDQLVFQLCGHECGHEEHKSLEDPDPSVAPPAKSFCTLKLKHKLVFNLEDCEIQDGFCSQDGHHFTCKHSAYSPSNIIFVVDTSGSMDRNDHKPEMVRFRATHNNRLGCVYEALVRFIRTRASCLLQSQRDLASVVLFAGRVATAIELEDMDESIVNTVLASRPAGRTQFSKGLEEARRILRKSLQAPRYKPRNRNPVMIFLSDGENSSRDVESTRVCVRGLMSEFPQLVIHTILFGDKREVGVLREIALQGRGTFHVSINHLQLSKRYEELANSIKPVVQDLMY